MRLGIASAFYELKGFSTYIESLFYGTQMLKDAGVEAVFLKRECDAYVERAKNAILAMFLQSECDQLLMIDSDMSWDMEGFKNIVVAPVDFVGGTYPKKNDWEEYCSQILQDENGFPLNYDRETGLIEAVFVPGGFLKLTRRAVERMSKAYEMYSYNDSDLNCVGLFQTSIENGVFQTEDVTFCKRWRALGEKVWLDPRITFGHSGTREWKGNYHEYLLRQPGGRDDPAREKVLENG